MIINCTLGIFCKLQYIFQIEDNLFVQVKEKKKGMHWLEIKGGAESDFSKGK